MKSKKDKEKRSMKKKTIHIFKSQSINMNIVNLISLGKSKEL